MLRNTFTLNKQWWTTYTEQKTRYNMMYGGVETPISVASFHKLYLNKYRRGAFPSRTRKMWSVAQGGRPSTQRPHKYYWPYDVTGIIFNQRRQKQEKLGYVTSTDMMKTAVVACNHMVYYPKYNQRVAKQTQYFAHDEDLACVSGDLVHIKQCRRISKFKAHYVFSILEPNVEGRERLKLGLPAVPSPLFGRRTSARIVKLNLNAEDKTKEKLASALQEQVQNFYKYTGSPSPSTMEGSLTSFEEATNLIAPNAAQTPAQLGRDQEVPVLAGGQEFERLEEDTRELKPEELYGRRDPEVNDVSGYNKSP